MKGLGTLANGVLEGANSLLDASKSSVDFIKFSLSGAFKAYKYLALKSLDSFDLE